MRIGFPNARRSTLAARVLALALAALLHVTGVANLAAQASAALPAGQFIKADLSSITAAATGAMPASGNGYRVSILYARNKDAYPIRTFTWILVPREGLSAGKRSCPR